MSTFKMKAKFANASVIKRKQFKNKLGLKLDFETERGDIIIKTLHIPQDIGNKSRDISKQMKKLGFHLYEYHQSLFILLAELETHLKNKTIHLFLKKTGKSQYPWDITDWLILKDNT